MITESTIRDLSECNIGPSTILFYIWLIVRYDSRPFSIPEAVEGYSRPQRTIQRYLSTLRKMEMIEYYQKPEPGQSPLFKIAEANL